MPKTSKIEYDKRIMMIQEWIIENYPSRHIDQQIFLKGWCQSTRHAKRMRAEAWDRLCKYEEASIDERRKKKIFELEQRKRTLQNQFKGTPAGIHALIAVDKEIIKLEGLVQPVKKDEDQPPSATAIAISGSDITFEQAYILKYGKPYEPGAVG